MLRCPGWGWGRDSRPEARAVATGGRMPVEQRNTVPRVRGSLRRRTQRTMAPWAAEPVGTPTASQMLARPRTPLLGGGLAEGPLEAGAPGSEPWLRVERRADAKTTSSRRHATHRPLLTRALPFAGSLHAGLLAPSTSLPAGHASLPAAPHGPRGTPPWHHLSRPEQSDRSLQSFQPPPNPCPLPNPCFQLLTHSDAAHIAEGH